MLDHQILACQALRHRCDAAMGKVCAADLGNRMLGPQLAVNLFQGIKCHRKTGCRIFRLDHQMIRFLDLLLFLFRFEIPVFHYGFLFLFKFMNRSFLALFLCLCRFQVADIPENTCLPFGCALFLIVRLDLGHFFCQRFFRLCFMKACYYILVQRSLFYFLVRRFCLGFRFSSLLFWLCLLWLSLRLILRFVVQLCLRLIRIQILSFRFRLAVCTVLVLFFHRTQLLFVLLAVFHQIHLIFRQRRILKFQFHCLIHIFAKTEHQHDLVADPHTVVRLVRLMIKLCQVVQPFLIQLFLTISLQRIDLLL